MSANPTPTAMVAAGALVHESAALGAGVQIRHGASVAAAAVVGSGSLIEEGARVGPAVIVGADSRIGPNAVLMGAGTDPAAELQDGVVVGANATVVAGALVGAGAVVRPGAVVARSVPPRAIVEGNPAVIIGYTDTERSSLGAASAGAPRRRAVEATAVRGVTLHRFAVVPDLRGNLTVGEFEREIPFLPRRYFMVFGVPNREVRGEHAHRECHQFLLCVRGSVSVVADDGQRRLEVLLDAPELGLYLPPMTWGIQYKYSADALLLVFASHFYDAADYIRDYAEYLAAVQSPSAS
jgi:UDP-2-acetamido-3-amino-2,3-dideoxy-glucuronate N-acetyltransferase